MNRPEAIILSRLAQARQIPAKVESPLSEKAFFERTNNMKKKIVAIALAAFALVGTAVYLNAQTSKHTHSDEGILQCGTKCTFCNGTGFNGNFNCAFCKGTGRNNGY